MLMPSTFSLSLVSLLFYTRAYEYSSYTTCSATNALRPVHYPNMTRMPGDVKVSSPESMCYSCGFSCILSLKNDWHFA